MTAVIASLEQQPLVHRWVGYACVLTFTHTVREKEEAMGVERRRRKGRKEREAASMTRGFACLDDARSPASPLQLLSKASLTAATDAAATQ